MSETESERVDTDQNQESSALKELRQLCRDHRDRLHTLLHRCDQAGLLTDAEKRRYRIELKRLGDLRQSDDPTGVSEAIERYEELLEHYRSRLPDDGVNPSVDDLAGPADSENDKSNLAVTGADVSALSSRGLKGADGDQRASSGDGDEGVRIRTRRVDELSPEQWEVLGKRRILVKRMEEGHSAPEAVERSGLDCSPRTALNYYYRWEEDGMEGLFDDRWLNGGSSKVLTQRVRTITKALVNDNPAAPLRKIHEEVAEYCRQNELEVPSYESVRKYLRELPESTQIVLWRKLEDWDDEARPTVRVEDCNYGNEIWEIDQTPLPIWIRVRDGNEFVPTRPHLTVALDKYSRSVAGFVLTEKHPNVETVLRLLRRSIQPKDIEGWANQGMPEVVVTDHGAEFMAGSVVSALNLLGIKHEPAPPDYPQGKPRVERFFGTVDTGFSRTEIPGHTDTIGKSEGAAQKRITELPTLEMLRDVFTDWLVTEYQAGTRGDAHRTRQECWEETARLRMPAEDELNTLLHKTNRTRVVRRTGVQLTIEGTKHLYWAPFLAQRFREKVRLWYTPDDPGQVLVYADSTGDFLGEAYDLRHPDSKYDVDDVKEERRRYRRAQKKRLEQLNQEIEELNEAKRDRETWEAAHESGGAPAAPIDSDANSTEADVGVEALNIVDRHEETPSKTQPADAVSSDGIEQLNKADRGEL